MRLGTGVGHNGSTGGTCWVRQYSVLQPMSACIDPQSKRLVILSIVSLQALPVSCCPGSWLDDARGDRCRFALIGWLRTVLRGAWWPGGFCTDWVARIGDHGFPFCWLWHGWVQVIFEEADLSKGKWTRLRSKCSGKMAGGRTFASVARCLPKPIVI